MLRRKSRSLAARRAMGALHAREPASAAVRLRDELEVTRLLPEHLKRPSAGGRVLDADDADDDEVKYARDLAIASSLVEGKLVSDPEVDARRRRDRLRAERVRGYELGSS